MSCMNKLIYSVIFFIPLPLIGICQHDTAASSQFVQKDVKDWLVQKKWIKPKPEKNNFLLVIPIIASNPTAGFIFGVGLTYAYKLSPNALRISTVSSNATYSTNKMVNLNVKSNIFTLKDRLVLNGDWRYLVNSETTYGLGTHKRGSTSIVDVNGYATGSDSSAQPLKYNQIRIHEVASMQMIPNFFAGLGLHWDNFYNIDDQTLKNGDTAGSYHYQYSIAKGFKADKYDAVGLSLNFLFDSRDNQIDAYKGYYGNINYRVNFTELGSSRASSVLLAEYRSFHSLDHGRNRHTLAFWAYGNFVTSGNVPYLLLPALGYDQRQRSGRGYTFGRFRGEDLVYGESEYRFPVSPRTGILGGVLFVNVTTASDRQNDVRLFDYLRAGYGGGLRIMLDKKTRTRLEVDAGIANHSLGFYLGAQETF